MARLTDFHRQQADGCELSGEEAAVPRLCATSGVELP
jgi:hypothetical protein